MRRNGKRFDRNAEMTRKLMMMVAAYAGYDLLMESYRVALKEGYKFGAYGDAMLIL